MSRKKLNPLAAVGTLNAALRTCRALTADPQFDEWARRDAVVVGSYIDRLLRRLVEDPKQATPCRETEPPDVEESLKGDLGMGWATHGDRLCPLWAWLYPETMARPHEVAVVATRAMILATYYTAAWRRVGGLDAEGLKALGRGSCEAFYRWHERAAAEVIRQAEQAAKGGTQ